MTQWQDVAHWPDLVTDLRVARAAFGDHVSDEVERSQLALMVEEVVERMVARQEEGVVAELDYTEESLQWLDAMIDAGFSQSEPPEEAVLEALVMDWGSYLALMILDNLGGEWHFRQPLWHSSIYFPSTGAACFPYHRIAKRFLLGRDESVSQYYQALVDLLTAA